MTSKKNNFVLVTGGAGFIGSHLCDRLLKAGKKVLVIDDFNDFYDPVLKKKNIAHNLKNKNYTLVKGDITNSKTIDNLFKKYSIDLVYHLAARAGVRPSITDPKLYEKTNIQGTMNLLEAAKNAKVSKFIFASSSSVYGNNKKVPFAETDFVDNPISPYAATKKAGELLCYTYSHLYNLPIACMRFFTVYGPRQRPEMAIHKFITAISQGKEIPMYGDGKTQRDYTYIEDIVYGLIKAAEVYYQYEVFNLGNSDTIGLLDLINLIGKTIGKKPLIKHLPNQPGDVEITYADIHKAQKILDYNPKTKIANGLEKMLSWYQGETQW